MIRSSVWSSSSSLSAAAGSLRCWMIPARQQQQQQQQRTLAILQVRLPQPPQRQQQRQQQSLLLLPSIVAPSSREQGLRFLSNSSSFGVHKTENNTENIEISNNSNNSTEKISRKNNNDDVDVVDDDIHSPQQQQQNQEQHHHRRHLILRRLDPDGPFRKTTPVQLIDMYHGNIIDCWPLWLIQDPDSYNDKWYLAVKPVQQPVALYMHDIIDNDTDINDDNGNSPPRQGEERALPPPKYVPMNHPFLKEILPLVQERLYIEYDGQFRVFKTPQTLRLQGPPLAMEDYKGRGEFKSLLDFQVVAEEEEEQKQEDFDSDDTNHHSNKSQQQQQQPRRVRRVYLVRPLYPVLHVARIFRKTKGSNDDIKLALISTKECMELFPRIQDGNSDAENELLEQDNDFLLHGGTDFLFSGQGLVPEAESVDDSNDPTATEAAEAAVAAAEYKIRTANNIPSQQ